MCGGSAGGSRLWSAARTRRGYSPRLPRSRKRSGNGRAHFLPYLSGERTPPQRSRRAGRLLRPHSRRGRRALVYSVIEGVSFGLADGLDALASAGTRARHPLAGGRGSRSALWRQLLAGRPANATPSPRGSEAGGALGAARLGHLASGGTSGPLCARRRWRAEHSPSRDAGARFQGRLERFPRPVPGALSRLERCPVGGTARSVAKPRSATEHSQMRDRVG